MIEGSVKDNHAIAMCRAPQYEYYVNRTSFTPFLSASISACSLYIHKYAYRSLGNLLKIGELKDQEGF
jgi:hypothetical protein